jgi:hypothetical protein
MFIKKTKVNSVTYLQITKSFRKGSKVRHKVILNLGRDDKINFNDVDALISVLQEMREEYQNGKSRQ